jgi:hypothetical protein
MRKLLMRLFCSLYSFCVCNSISLNAVELIRLQGQETPIYIWYESYPTHSGEGYEGRVSRVSPDSPFGAASLNLTIYASPIRAGTSVKWCSSTVHRINTRMAPGSIWTFMRRLGLVLHPRTLSTLI